MKSKVTVSLVALVLALASVAFGQNRPSTDIVAVASKSVVRSQYLLGFSPSDPGRPGTLRKLQVRTTRSDLIVQARKGLVDRSGAASYYVPKDNKR